MRGGPQAKVLKLSPGETQVFAFHIWHSIRNLYKNIGRAKRKLGVRCEAWVCNDGDRFEQVAHSIPDAELYLLLESGEGNYGRLVLETHDEKVFLGKLPEFFEE